MRKSLNYNGLAKRRHSSAVMAASRATAERRAALASDFRARLLAELGGGPLPASRAALAECAVSAYTQMTELSARFTRANATPRAQQALAIARGQLQRALRALGLVENDTDDAPPQTVEQILAEVNLNG